MSNKFNQIISLASMLVLIWSGCKPGLDVTALKLKADEVVDYGALIKTKLSPGTRAYGLLKKDYNLSSENRIQGELDKILDALSAIQQLDPNIPNTNDFIAEYRNLFTRVISPMLVGIEKSSEKAAKLANNMAGVVASDSNLRKDIEKLKRAWAGAAGAAGSRDSFNLQSGIVLSSAERIYQMAVLYSQAKVQADFYEKLSGIRAAFDTLETKLGAALTFENSHERSQALAEFNLLEGILSSLESIASKITSTARVSESINEIGLQLMRKLGVLGLNPGINDEIKIAQEKVQKALNFNKLRVENVQNVKVVVDPELQKLQKEAFSGAVVVPTIAAEIKQDTDLNIFMRTLGANTIVATKTSLELSSL